MRLAPSPIMLVFGLFLYACGADGSGLQRYGFSTHALECEVEGLEAWLIVSGIEGACPLQVASDRTVSGACADVPAGSERLFSIEYFVMTGGVRLRLAVARLIVDLTNETRARVPVDFSQAELDTSFNVDQDSLTNIAEFCMGTDPLNALDPPQQGGG